MGLGAPVTLGQARERSQFLRLPGAAGLGRPDAIYLGEKSVSLVYGERPGYARAGTTGAALLVQEFPARIGRFIEKAVGPGGRAWSGCASAARPRTSSPARTASPTKAARAAASRSSAWRGTRCWSSARTGC